MFSSSLQLASWSIFRFIFYTWVMCSTAVIAICQELPEKKLSKADLQRPGVASVVERLSALRKSQERLGPKHPSLPSVLKQISKLEQQLSKLTGKVITKPSPSLQPSLPSMRSWLLRARIGFKKRPT
jgi:hypothetical protein